MNLPNEIKVIIHTADQELYREIRKTLLGPNPLKSRYDDIYWLRGKPIKDWHVAITAVAPKPGGTICTAAHDISHLVSRQYAMGDGDWDQDVVWREPPINEMLLSMTLAKLMAEIDAATPQPPEVSPQAHAA